MFYGHHRGERHGTSNGDCHRCQYLVWSVAQASLTGESLPVEKAATTRQPEHSNPLECDTLCFMGTTVVSGTAQAMVIATGANTWFGQLAGRVSEQESEPNAFQQGISRVSMLLIRFMLVMAPVVLLINGYTKGDWWEAALFALSVAVGLTPEMLPMIVTSTLARGAVKLSKQKVIVKHLDAIQNFGAMDILCTDKTGTIRFMLVMAPVVLLINGYTKGDWWEAALFALSVAVGLTPELLPMIVTSTLARGAVKLSKHKVIVKHLDAIQNFGAMDILCTDKTGTLTQDKIVLENHTAISGKTSERVLHSAWAGAWRSQVVET